MPRFASIPYSLGLAVCVALLPSCAQDATPPGPAAAPVAATAPPIPTPDAERFTALSLADFSPFPTEATSWSENQGLLTTTGKPKGYLFSKASHQNFTWRAEFRFVPDPDGAPDRENTGFLLFIQEPQKVWPRSLEVQGKPVEMGQIRPNGGIKAVELEDNPAAREAARRPTGEWNQIEIDCVDGAVTATLNGTIVCKGQAGELRSGLIGLQSENYPVQFRNLRIQDH